MECNDLIKKIEGIKGWEKTNDGREAFFKLFKFSDFKQAFSFMTSIAMKAEQINHHPEWKNVYNKVEVDLQTHDAGSVTKKDFELAEYMDEAFKKFL